MWSPLDQADRETKVRSRLNRQLDELDTDLGVQYDQQGYQAKNESLEQASMQVSSEAHPS